MKTTFPSKREIAKILKQKENERKQKQRELIAKMEAYDKENIPLVLSDIAEKMRQDAQAARNGTQISGLYRGLSENARRKVRNFIEQKGFVIVDNCVIMFQ